MKKLYCIILSSVLWVILSLHGISAQNTIAHDQASNYGSEWSGNGGYGFQGWTFQVSGGSGGRFLGSSHQGRIDTQARAFGMWGDSGWCNATRMFNAPLNPEHEFSIELSIHWRSGGREFNLLNSTGAVLFNFNVTDAGYGSTGWGWQENSHITLSALQIDNNHFQVFLHRRNDNVRWTGSIIAGRVAGFNAYVGNTGGGAERNFYINSPRISSMGRIYLAEGLRLPGQWNGWANDHGMAGDFALVRTTTGTWRYQTTFQYLGTGSSQNFKFVSSGVGANGQWLNQWSSNASVQVGQMAYFNFGLNTDNPVPGNNTISGLTQNRFYTVVFHDRGYTGSRAVFMETTAVPVNISSVSQSPGVVSSSNTVLVTATLSDTPTEQEIFYLRYSTDGWDTSTLATMTGQGTARTANIPAQSNGTQVSYYVFSSTVGCLIADHDMYTMRINNNGGCNYLYEVGQTAVCEDVVLYTTPAFPQTGQSITIHLNTALGNRDLVDHTGDVYVHTGVITNLSVGISDWRYVKTNWGVNTPETMLVKHSANNYSLNITDIRDFYGVSSNEEILKLVMVFRSASDPYKIHRNADGSDFIVNVYQNALNVKMTSPAGKNKLIEANRLVSVCAVALANTNLKIFINATEVTSVASHAVSILVSLHGLPTGLHYVIAEAGNGSTTVRDSLPVFIRGAVSIESLPTFISGKPSRHRPGIHYHPDNTTVTLVLHDPPGLKNHVFVIGDFNHWNLHQDYYMNHTPDGMYFWRTISGLTPDTEYAYQYLINNELRLADPYTEKVLDPWNDHWISRYNYPNLKPYPAGKTTRMVSVLHPGRPEYQWQATDYTRPINQDLVIYELHIRDFVESDAIKDVIAKLDYLHDLGINAIELMPINEFEGNDSWGYNPSFYFAPDKAYGTRFDYKLFIDECHKRGIAVIMDIVLNHSFNQSSFAQLYFDENAGNWGKPTPDNPWFLVDSPPLPWSWGNTFDQDSRFTHDLFNRILEHWLAAYKVDGFRFDFTKGFSNHPSGNDGWDWDQRRIDNLKRIADQVWAASPGAFVILEHLTDNPEERELANYGMMIWGNMEPRYAQATMGFDTNSDLSWGLHTARGYTYHNLISYMESHDEERLMYKNLTYGNQHNPDHNPRNLNVALARNELAAVFYLTAPGPKMIWQFGELGYDYSINFNGRVGRKPIRWDYLDVPARRKLYDVFSAMIKLKAEHPVFRASNITHGLGGYLKRIHLNENADGSGLKVTLLGNFDVGGRNITPHFQHTGTWHEHFTGNSHQVNNTTDQIWLEPGEYRLYFSEKVYKEYFSRSTGDLSLLSSWGTSADGTGAAPPNFTQTRAHYHVRNNATPQFATSTNISGDFHRLFVGANGHNVNLAVNANLTAGIIEVAPGSTLSVKSGNHLVVTERLRNEGTVVVDPGGKITVEGVLSNTGAQNIFVLGSDATATATLMHDTHGVGGKMERHIITDGWHFVSAPVENMNIIGSDFVPGSSPLTTNFDFYFFDEMAPEVGGNWFPWINVRGAGGIPNTSRFQQFVPGRGYLAAYRSGYHATNPFAFEGRFGTGNFQTQVYHGSTSNHIKGWNLLGNPYPSSIDWNLANKNLFQDNFAYVYNQSKTGGPGYENIDGTLPNALIAPGQAFFVLANASSHNHNFTFSNDLRTHGGTWMKNEPVSNKLVLRLEHNGSTDESTVRIKRHSQYKRDRTDALKLFSFNSQMPQLFTTSADGVNLAINTVPAIENNSEIFVGFLAPNEGRYTISLAKLYGDLSNRTIFIEDLQTGYTQNLSLLPSYSFNSVNGMTSSRFKLFFDQPTNITETNNLEAKIHYRENYIYANFTSEGQNRNLSVFDISGKRVFARDLGHAKNHKIQVNLAPGIYLVRVIAVDAASTTKVVVR